jgi:hypothetical protein
MLGPAARDRCISERNQSWRPRPNRLAARSHWQGTVPCRIAIRADVRDCNLPRGPSLRMV